MNHKDYYQILGIECNATEDEIQDAFHELARKYHPDVNPDPRVVERFKEISAAYDVLSDPEDRAKYDMQIGANRRRRQQTSSRPSGTDWHQQTTYNRARTTWAHKWSRKPSEQSEKKRKDPLIVTMVALVGSILMTTTLIINALIDAIDPSIKTVSLGWESYVVILFIVAGMGTLGWGLYLRRRSKCPRCGKSWAREILSKGKDTLYYKEVLLDGPPSVAYVQYMVRYRCKYCEHKWTSPQGTVEVSFPKR